MNFGLSSRALLILVVLGMLATAFLLGGDPDRTDSTRLSPLGVGPGGGKGLSDALLELDLTQGTLQRPWSDWIGETFDSVLVVVGPTSAVDDYEAERLVSWIEGGGRLLWAPGEIVFAGLGASRMDTALAERLGVTPRTARRFGREAHRAATVPEPPLVARLALAGAPSEWETWNRSFDIEGDFTPWIVDGKGNPCVAELQIGSGAVLLWSDVKGLRNDKALAEPTAASFLRTVAVWADGDPVVLDGYSHGLAALGSIPLATRRWLVQDRFGNGVLIALLVGLAWLGINAVRRAPIVPTPPPAGRSSVEHVDALAQAYERARAHERPTRLILDHARSQLGTVDLERRLTTLERTHPELLDSIERLRAASGQKDGTSPAELLTLTHDVDRILAAHTHPRGPRVDPVPAP